MFDLIIRGDQVVTPQGAGAWDICVAGETIAAVAAPGTFDDSQAKRVIDATGKIVIPGGIDPHIHSSWPIPALEDGAASSGLVGQLPHDRAPRRVRQIAETQQGIAGDARRPAIVGIEADQHVGG